MTNWSDKLDIHRYDRPRKINYNKTTWEKNRKMGIPIYLRITDQNAYLDEVTRLYAKTGNDLNPVMRQQINAHVRQGAEFGLRDDKGVKGIPGLHAEVQSANYVLNQAKATPGFDVSRIQVSTYKIQNSPGQGAPFTACNHCGGILKDFDILTGY